MVNGGKFGAQAIYKRASVFEHDCWRPLGCVETQLKDEYIDKLSDRTGLPVTSYFNTLACFKMTTF
jgi:hypothetical protein